MKNGWFKLAASILLLIFFTACSTQKNTWSTRHFHEINTRFNVHFNGNEAYKQGIKQLSTSHKEDFSKILPVYKVSNHTIAKGTASSMDKATEKSQTAIKKHSIRVKPKKKINSKSKESYKRFYNKEEFNPFMDDVFLLMANAQFHKADFESASATCSYIMRHFATDKLSHDKAAILLARCYTELEWTYEAENILSDLNSETLSSSLTGAYSAAYADFLLRKKKYSEAIPYIKIALDKSGKKDEKHRWRFLLGQLYQETGRRTEANKIFGAIPSKNPPYEMEISARIRQTEVYPEGNTTKPLKKLLRLSRSDKNKNYLDQIHYALGNLFLLEGDTAKALENFHESLTKSTQNGPHKLKTLLTLGNFYYETENFLKAGPCFAEAETMLDKTDERFKEASFKATALKELVPPLRIIYDEDSLQSLAKLPEKELNEIIEKMVKEADKKAKEEAKTKSIDAALNANEQLNEGKTTDNGAPKIPDIQDPTNRNWYFYNPSTVAKGLTEFQSKWGKRTLADDWRRNNKVSPFETSAIDTIPINEVESSDTTLTEIADTTTAADKFNFSEGADDPTNPNYYLKNIPFTEEQILTSNEKIAENLFKSGVFFRELMENNRLSLEYFRNLEKRFPESLHLENAWYNTYLLLKQEKRDSEAEIDRNKLIVKYPESKFALRLSDSMFIENLIEMYLKQDNIYSKTYMDFTGHQTDSIFKSSNFVKTKYPLSKLLPRFIFLEAMEYGRTGKPEEFHNSLISITENHPDHEIVPVVKEMLALWNAGKRPVPSPDYISKLSLDSLMKDESISQIDSLTTLLTYTPDEPHVLLMEYIADSTNTNRLLFDVALYNFTTFLIKDYELSLSKVGKMDVLLINGFENAEEVDRYRSGVSFQNELPEIKYPGIKMVVISAYNLQLLMQGVDPDTYMKFYKENYTGIKPEIKTK